MAARRSHHRCIRPAGRQAFSLLEALVALSLMAIVVTVLMRVHAQTLRAELFARRLGDARGQADNLVSGLLLGYDVSAMGVELRSQGWTVDALPAGTGVDPAAWRRIRVAASNDAAPGVEFFLKL